MLATNKDIFHFYMNFSVAVKPKRLLQISDRGDGEQRRKGYFLYFFNPLHLVTNLNWISFQVNGLPLEGKWELKPTSHCPLPWSQKRCLQKFPQNWGWGRDQADRAQEDRPVESLTPLQTPSLPSASGLNWAVVCLPTVPHTWYCEEEDRLQGSKNHKSCIPGIFGL